jgi:hypothetical protein
MISFSGSLKVFLSVEPVDMRAGFERLACHVGEVLKEDLRQGSLPTAATRASRSSASMAAACG